jgi:hypothetical protein
MAAHLYWRLNITANDGDPDFLAVVQINLRGMTGGANLCSGGTASASSAFFPASYALDNDVNTYWTTQARVLAATWQYQFANAVSVVEYTLQARTSEMDRMARAWTLEYSDDGAAWTVADTRSNQTGWAAGEVRTYVLPGTPTTYLYDTFTEAANKTLDLHTPEVGGAWSAYGSPYTGAINVLATEGRAGGSSDTQSALYTNAAALPADYRIEATLRLSSAPSTATRPGIAARYSASGTENGYLFFHDGTKWLLRRLVNGAVTDLASYTGFDASSTDYHLQWVLAGSSHQITLDGIPIITVNDSGVLTGGRVGLLLRSQGRVDNLVVMDNGAAALPRRLGEIVAEALVVPTAVERRLMDTAVEALTQTAVPAQFSDNVVEVLLTGDGTGGTGGTGQKAQQYIICT